MNKSFSTFPSGFPVSPAELLALLAELTPPAPTPPFGLAPRRLPKMPSKSKSVAGFARAL